MMESLMNKGMASLERVLGNFPSSKMLKKRKVTKIPDRPSQVSVVAQIDVAKRVAKETKITQISFNYSIGTVNLSQIWSESKKF